MINPKSMVALSNKLKFEGIIDVTSELEYLLYDITNMIDIYRYEFKFNEQVFTGEEGFADSIKSFTKNPIEHIKAFLKWLYIKISEFVNKIINFIKLLIIKIKKFLFREKYKNSRSNDKSNEELFKEKMNNIKEFLLNTQLRIIPENDVEALTNIQHQVILQLKKYIFDNIQTEYNRSATIYKRILTNSNYIDTSNCSSATLDYVIGKTSMSMSIPKINGIEILKDNRANSIDIDNIKYENFSSSFENIINSLQKISDNISKNFDLISADLRNTLNSYYIQTIYLEILFVKFGMSKARILNKLANPSDKDNRALNESANRISNTFTEACKRIPVILITNAGYLVNFYNELIEKFNTEFKEYKTDKTINLTDPKVIRDILNNVPTKGKIEGINWYLFSDIFKYNKELRLKLVNDILYSAISVITGEHINPILVLGDEIYKICTAEERTAILYHEYGHYKLTHIGLKFDKLFYHLYHRNHKNLSTLKLRDIIIHRYLTSEWQADCYTVEKCGIDPLLNALKKLKNLPGSNEELEKRIKLLELWKRTHKKPSINEIRNNP